MPTVQFIGSQGSSYTVEVAAGTSLMQAAVNNGVPGIVADCGGFLSCATCHVYVDQAWLETLPAASEEEMAMVECALDLRPNSRLSCQITVNDSVDGIILHIPKVQC